MHEAIKAVDCRMQDFDLAFYKSAKNPNQPFSNLKYKPEMDTSDFCTPDQHQFYQHMIGIMRWMIDIGRLYITTEVSLISCYLIQPRKGHLIQVLHMFSYLKTHQSMDLCYDPTKIKVNETTTNQQDRACNQASVM